MHCLMLEKQEDHKQNFDWSNKMLRLIKQVGQWLSAVGDVSMWAVKLSLYRILCCMQGCLYRITQWLCALKIQHNLISSTLHLLRPVDCIQPGMGIMNIVISQWILYFVSVSTAGEYWTLNSESCVQTDHSLHHLPFCHVPNNTLGHATVPYVPDPIHIRPS